MKSLATLYYQIIYDNIIHDILWRDLDAGLSKQDTKFSNYLLDKGFSPNNKISYYILSRELCIELLKRRIVNK